MEVVPVERAAVFLEGGAGDERCACPKCHGQNKMIKSEFFFFTHYFSFSPCVCM